MIDIRREAVLSLAEAAQLTLLPRRRRGKRPHMATLYRWAQRGLRGVHLETIRVGGTLCTSVEAIQRFCDRLSQGDTDNDQCESIGPTTGSDRAGGSLSDMGV
jgi:Protein of unknown function (DUF1580)